MVDMPRTIRFQTMELSFEEYQSRRAGDNVGHDGGARINSDQDGRDNKFTRGGLAEKAVCCVGQ